MIGAKDFGICDKYIYFKIGRNVHNINFIKIKLNSMDLYDLEFCSMKKYNIKIVKEVNGIYNDMLNKTISSVTGLNTRL
jgi:hypothetical protein